MKRSPPKRKKRKPVQSASPASSTPSALTNVQYRIELWRVSDPEMRIFHTVIEYQAGEYRSRDMLAQIAEQVYSFIESKIGKAERSLWDSQSYSAPDPFDRDQFPDIPKEAAPS